MTHPIENMVSPRSTGDVQNHSQLTARQTPRVRRARFLLALLILLALLFGGLSLWQASKTERVRAAYIPQLQIIVAGDPDNLRRVELLGARLAQAEQYPPACAALYHALGLGEMDPLVWLTMSGSEAAGGNLRVAMGVLDAGIHKGVPELKPAKLRVQALGPHVQPLKAAYAILPNGAAPLASARLPVSFLSSLVDWWGRRHPESSGYATRMQWSQDEPQNAEAQRYWAEALLADHQLANAHAPLARALALAPRSAEAYVDAGNLLLAERKVDEAGLEFQKALDLKADLLPAILGAGRVAIQKQLVPTAILLMEQATRLKPQSADAWIGLGQAYLGQLLKTQASLHAFEQAHRLAPERIDYYNDYSKALRLNYRLDEAETILHQRLARVPEDATSHILLARLYNDNHPTPKRLQMAEQEYRLALKLLPRNPRAEIELAHLLVSQTQVSHNQAAEAIQLLQDARSREPFDAMAATTLARAFLAAGRTKDAQQAAENATFVTRYHAQFDLLEDGLSHTPADPVLHLQLAKLYAATGQHARAQEQTAIVTRLQQHPVANNSDLSLLALPGSVSQQSPQ